MQEYMTQFFKVIKDNIVTILTGDYAKGDADLNQLGNLALLRLDRVAVTPSVKGIPGLSWKQKLAVWKFYWPYKRFITDRYHRLYTYKNGRFSPAYIPEELCFMYIDRYFSEREEARFVDNKSYYYRLLSNVKLPELVTMRIGQTWLNEKLEPVSMEDAGKLIKEEEEVVVKRAVNSEGGYGVAFAKGAGLSRNFAAAMHRIPCDVVIQRPIRQHPMLAKLHPESVNTIRIVSVMTQNKIKVYSACLKIGSGTYRVDNACHGGMYCGIKSDGFLREQAYLDDGTILKRHPDLGYEFKGLRVPHFDKVIRLAKEAHGFLGHFRMISWDVTVDDQGEAVLVEANLTLGGINAIQMCNGPLFGKDTKKILDEVFYKKKR